MNDYFYIITTAITVLSCFISYHYGIAKGTKDLMDYLVSNNLIEIIEEDEEN